VCTRMQKRVHLCTIVHDSAQLYHAQALNRAQFSRIRHRCVQSFQELWPAVCTFLGNCANRCIKGSGICRVVHTRVHLSCDLCKLVHNYPQLCTMVHNCTHLSMPRCAYLCTAVHNYAHLCTAANNPVGFVHAARAQSCTILQKCARLCAHHRTIVHYSAEVCTIVRLPPHHRALSCRSVHDCVLTIWRTSACFSTGFKTNVFRTYNRPVIGKNLNL
jgi:hypothetical protein